MMSKPLIVWTGDHTAEGEGVGVPGALDDVREVVDVDGEVVEAGLELREVAQHHHVLVALHG